MMVIVTLDCTGLRCPQPVLKVATKVPEMKAGDILEVSADCPSFPQDLKSWSEKTKRTMLFCRNEGGKFKAQIQF